MNHNITKVILGYFLAIPLAYFFSSLNAIIFSLIQCIIFIIFYSLYDKIIKKFDTLKSIKKY